MHHDVMRLVDGGYNAAEILAAFQGVYGEQVLMAPLRQGFNLVGYIMPFAAIIAAGGVTAGLIRKWGRRAQSLSQPAAPASVDASPEELEALQAALRDDS
jgi:cytochrome c-type biogenesis protein CcmH/NrfF